LKGIIDKCKNPNTQDYWKQFIVYFIMAQKKLTSENIAAIVTAIAERSGKDVDDCMRAVLHLLPRKMADTYTPGMIQAASDGDDTVNLHALSMTQLKSVARARNLTGCMKLSKGELIIFIQSNGTERPRSDISGSERTQRRNELIETIIPLFGTDEFAASVENWNIFTARNLQFIARSNENFMKGKRSRLVSIKRADLLREMFVWRKPDEDEEKGDEPTTPPRIRRTSSDWGHRTGASPARSKSRTPQRKKKSDGDEENGDEPTTPPRIRRTSSGASSTRFRSRTPQRKKKSDGP